MGQTFLSAIRNLVVEANKADRNVCPTCFCYPQLNHARKWRESDRGEKIFLGESAIALSLMVVPEPSTLVLLVAGAIGLLGWAWA